MTKEITAKQLVEYMIQNYKVVETDSRNMTEFLDLLEYEFENLQNEENDT